MAKYSISKEGSDLLKALADNLNKCTEDINDSNIKLERSISSVENELGIYVEEIVSIVSCNKTNLREIQNIIYVLVKKINQKADEILELLTFSNAENSSLGEQKYRECDNVISESASKSNIDGFIEGVIDTTGNINSEKMRNLRIAVQKGTFTKEDIRNISKRMAELGITKEYEDVMKNMDFGKYLKNVSGEPSVDMINPHAHHILFKTGNGFAQHALVEEGQNILRKYEIDPIIGQENLIWAPNAINSQHNTFSLKKVVDALKVIDEAGGDYDDIVEALELLGLEASMRR